MTRKPKITTISEPDNDSDYQVELDALISTKTSRKRAAPKALNNKPKKRGNSGKLEGIDTKLPKELVFLILGYLDPQTLINLSRANKQFRQTLLSSDLFWKTSRQAVGLPDLEAQDISERQYLLLVFDRDCHACSKPGVERRVNPISCTRLCGECAWEMTARESTNVFESLHPKTEECAKDSGPRGGWIPRGIVKMSQKLYQLSDAEVEDFVAERRLLKEQIARDGFKIIKWLRGREHEQREEDKVTKKARIETIKEHLFALGWTDETLVTGWDWGELVAQPEPLTPRIWKALKAPLVKYLRLHLIRARNSLRRRALMPHYQKLLEEDPQPDLFPHHRDFFEMRSLDAIWLKEEGPPAAERLEFHALVEADWLAALPGIRADVFRYGQMMRDHAVQRLTEGYKDADLPVPESPIDDPRSYFYYSREIRHHDRIMLPFPAIHGAIRDNGPGNGSVHTTFLNVSWWYCDVALKGVSYEW
ncbi:hypothetical protein FPV67DRAFT_1473039 [Lyophyllum atratum]|nr:hypothetical protein FPV67DRAFT_1473039 [Lyophyllum atratum]